MQGILPLKQLFTWAWTAILVFSFCTAGCHPLEDAVPLPQATVKNEKSNTVPVTVVSEIGYSIARSKNGSLKKSPETSSERDASGILLPENDNASIPLRDPFALPLRFQQMHSETIVQKLHENKNSAIKIPLQSIPLSGKAETVPPILTAQAATSLQDSIRRKTSIPCSGPVISGIFGNGKEKFTLLRWNDIQGIFKCGQQLKNGYFIKEITDSTVSFSSVENELEKNSFTLTLF